jgi:predicted dehydrogenase
MMQIAVIGCGRIAMAHLSAIAETPSFHLAALCDADEPTLSRAASTWSELARGHSLHNTQPKLFTDYQHILSELNINAVVLCTPPVTHAPIAMDLLERGIHVLCEKPLATRAEDARKMIAAARSRNAHLTLASKFRFVDDVIRAHRMLHRGELGDVIFFHCSFCQPVDMSGRWNAVPDVSGGGVLMDNGPHAIDIAQFLLGPIQQVQVRFSSSSQNLGVEDTAHLSFCTGGGVSGDICLSWSAFGASNYISVHGTRGSIELGWNRSHYHGARSTHSEMFATGGYNKHAAFLGQMQAFAACLKGERQNAVPLHDALSAVEVIEAAYAAVHTASCTGCNRTSTDDT